VSDTGLRRGVAWNLIPVALLAIVGLGMNLVIGGAWGEAALGVFNQVTTAYFVVAVLGAFGINYSVVRAIAERPDDRDRVAAIVVGGLVPVASLAAIVTFGFVALRWHIADFLDSTAVATGMSWVAPALFCFSINKLLLGVANGLGRMRAFAIYTSLRYVGLAAALIVARAYDVPAERLPVVWTVSANWWRRCPCAARAAGANGRAGTSTTARAASSRRSCSRSTRGSTCGCSAR
jgi:O-antigen/teichoic acid export membrane protein